MKTRVLAAALVMVCTDFGSAAPVDFSHEIVPLLQKKCAECHTGTKRKGGLSIDDRAALLKGGEDGPAVTLGNSSKSSLYQRVVSKDKDVLQEIMGKLRSGDFGVALQFTNYRS